MTSDHTSYGPHSPDGSQLSRAAVRPFGGLLLGRGRHRRRAVTIALALLTLPLAACEGEASSQASSTTISQADISRIAAAGTSSASSATASSVSSAGASASGAGQYVVPAAAKAHTHEGAKAFVTFYWETLGKLDEDPKKGVIPALSLKSCASCVKQEENVVYLVDKHMRVKTNGAVTGTYTIRPDSTMDSVVVQNVYSDAGTQHLSGTKVVASYPATRTVTETRADWTGTDWRIGAIGNLPTK